MKTERLEERMEKAGLVPEERLRVLGRCAEHDPEALGGPDLFNFLV